MAGRDRVMAKLVKVWFGLLIASGAMGVVADEQGRLVAARSLDWRVINDNVMGGRSLGDIARTGEFLSFSGSLNTNGGGFASIRVPARTVLEDEAAGVRLRVRGDGRTYASVAPQEFADFILVAVCQDGNGWRWLCCSSFWPNWRGRRLNARTTAAQVAELGLRINDGIDGAFALEVDWITTEMCCGHERLLLGYTYRSTEAVSNDVTVPNEIFGLHHLRYCANCALNLKTVKLAGSRLRQSDAGKEHLLLAQLHRIFTITLTGYGAVEARSERAPSVARDLLRTGNG